MTTRYLRPIEAKVRAKRVETLGPLVALSKTLGSHLAFSLPLDNVSRTGLLLSMGTNRKVPFLVNTLLELTVDPMGALLERPVTCLGKIVRMHQAQGAPTQFGVQIVQMEAKDSAMWEQALADLEAPETHLLDAG